MVSIYNSNYKSFLNIHTDAIIEYCTKNKKDFRKSDLDYQTNKHFGSIVSDFKSLIEATPEKLELIKKLFDNLSITDQNIILENFTVKKLYGYFSKNKGAFKTIANNKQENYHAAYLACNIDIPTCPYCNEHYTYSFEYQNKHKTIRRSFDWDHIYSQDHYPFLAISFFNLVPSCKVCNQIKSNQNKNYFNPHLNVNIDEIYYYEITPNSPDFLSNPKDLDLTIIYSKNKKYKNEIKNTIEVVGQLNRYRQHKELITDILNKKRIYPHIYKLSLVNQLSPLPISSNSNFRNYYFGIQFDHTEYHKRPFSKLTNDILRTEKS